MTLLTRAQQMVVLHTTTFCFLKTNFNIILPVSLVFKEVSSLQFSDKIVVLLYVLFALYCSMYCLCVNVYCHRVTTQLQLTNI